VNPDRNPLDDKAIAAVRAHFDEEMAEARVRYRAPRLSGRARRSGAGGPARLVPRAIGALAVVALAIVVGTTFWMVTRNAPVPGGTTASPSNVGAVGSASPSLASPSLASPSLASPSLASPSASASQSARPNIGTPNYLPGTVGMNGSTAWVLSDTGLSLSQDGGRTWSAVALPSGVKSSSVLAVSAVVSRAVWLAVNGNAGVVIYRKQGVDDWTSSTPLLPSWANATEWSGQPVQSTMVNPGPAALVTVGLGMAPGVEALFVSTDDGLTFTQHPPKASAFDQLWASVTFSSAQSGVLVAGAARTTQEMLHTSDGGNTWSSPTITGLPADLNYQFGSSLLAGSDIEVSVTTYSAKVSGDTNFLLLISHDGGATFAPAGPGIPSGGNFYPAFDSLGQVTWVAPSAGTLSASILEETTDGGQTWTTVTPAGLPTGVSSIHLTSATSATAVVVENGCTGVKTGCYTRTYLVATTDGGATWTNI
jgi:hypothetical protein